MEKILERLEKWKKAEIREIPSPKELSVLDLGILSFILREREREVRKAIEETVEAINERKGGKPVLIDDLIEKTLSCSTLHFIYMPRRGAKITCNLKEEGEWKTVNLLTVGESLIEEAKLLYKLLYFLKLLEKEGAKVRVGVG